MDTYYIFLPRAGAGDYKIQKIQIQITGNTLFFLIFFNFPQSTLFKDVCILLLMKPAFYFWTYFLFKHLFGFP